MCCCISISVEKLPLPNSVCGLCSFSEVRDTVASLGVQKAISKVRTFTVQVYHGFETAVLEWPGFSPINLGFHFTSTWIVILLVTVCWSVVLNPYQRTTKNCSSLVFCFTSWPASGYYSTCYSDLFVFLFVSMGCLCLVPYVSMLRMWPWVGMFYYGVITMTSVLPYPLNSLGLLLLLLCNMPIDWGQRKMDMNP